jgi:F420-dependent oxidoreductase-like protein
MKLGIGIGYSGAGLHLPMDLIQRAEQLGFDSVWTAEAYGSDAVTPLAYIAAQTSRIRLGTGIMQLAGRTPAMCAMQAQTVDALAGGGRFIAGLGVSGPQIVEGWYGQTWAKPIARTRDYVAIMRKVFHREAPVAHDGTAIHLPYAGPDATGLGKPLRSILHPNPDLPIYLAAGGPANVALAAEVADGWIPMGLSPANASAFRAALEQGAARSGRSLDTMAIQSSTTVHLTDDVAATIERMKPRIAMYVGGMGARDHNFHKDAMARRGYPDAADRIQELFLAGRREDAGAAVPDEYVDEGALIGSRERIAKRFVPWTECGITGLTIHTDRDDAVELMAELAGTDRADEGVGRE